MIRQTVILALILTTLVSSFPASLPVYGATFSVLTATWGTPTNPVEAGPGDKNVPLVATLRYLSSDTASSVEATLGLPGGFTEVTGSQNAEAFTLDVKGNSVFQLTFYLNIDEKVSLGTYILPMKITWTIASTKELKAESNEVSIQFKGKVKLNLDASQVSLEAGQVNNITVTLSNTGTGEAKEISTTISAPSQVSVLNRLPTVSALPASTATKIDLSLYAASTAAGVSVALSFAITYKDAYLNSRSSTQSLGFYIKVPEPPFFTISASPNTLLVGEANQVAITVRNSGKSEIKNMFLTLGVSPPISLVNSDGKSNMGDLKAGATSSLNIQLYVSYSTTSPVTVTITATYTDSLNTRSTETRSLSFFTNAKTLSPLSVELSTSTLTAGKLNRLTVKLKNQANSTLTNFYITTALTGTQLSLLDSNPIQVQDLSPAQSALFNLRIFAGNLQSPSTGTLQLTVTYSNPSGIQRTESFSFGLMVAIQARNSPISLMVSPATLTAGKINNITVVVSNLANYAISSISLSFTFSGGQVIWLEPDLIQILALTPGQTLTFYAKAYDPPQAPPSTLLQVSVKYYDDNEILNQEGRSIGLLSRGIIDLRVTDFSVIPEQPAPGQVFSITVTLTNIGTITASAVTATPQPVTGVRIFGSRSIFVGDMQVNTPTTFTISLQIANLTGPGRYQIPVELTYFDNLRNVMSNSIGMPFTVRERAGGSNPLRQPAPALDVQIVVPYVALAVTALVAGYLLGRRWGKR